MFGDCVGGVELREQSCGGCRDKEVAAAAFKHARYKQPRRLYMRHDIDLPHPHPNLIGEFHATCCGDTRIGTEEIDGAKPCFCRFH